MNTTANTTDQPIIGYVIHYQQQNSHGTWMIGMHERDNLTDALDCARGMRRYGYATELHERFRRFDEIDGAWVDDRRIISF